MLGCVFTLLRADVRMRNVDNPYFAKIISAESDAALYAEAHIISDVDWPGEGNGFLDKAKSRLEALISGYGLEYEAWARYEGEALTDDYEGTYEAHAGVPGDIDGDYHPLLAWDEDVDDQVKSTGRYKLHNNPKKWSDAEKEKYGNWEDIQAKTDLSLCTAWAKLTGEIPAIPGRWVVVSGLEEVDGYMTTVYWLEW